MSTSYNPKIVTDGLVLALDAANKKSYPGSGITWVDLSGNNNSGSLTNGPTFDTANGGTIVFAGDDDNINCGNNVSLRFSSQFSYSVWFNTTNLTGFKAILTHRNSGITSVVTNMYTSASTLYAEVKNDSRSYNKSIFSPFSVSTNTWYNYCLTVSSTQVVIYLNGVSYVADTTSAGPFTNFDTPVLIGRHFTEASQYFSGKIANVQIYNRALSAQEILQNFNAARSRFGV